MFNLTTPSTLLGIEGAGLSSTPKTPEIVNSLIAMTNPLDGYSFTPLNNGSAASTPGSAASLCGLNNAQNYQTGSQDSSHSSSSGSPLDSPAGTHTTPSVQQTCSQLIKAGLKLSIQSKRKLSTCDSSSGSDQPNCKYSRRDEDVDDSSDEENDNKSMPKGLTPEDEDRRRRRRERNKIAATKCRMKKRERTQNLIKESEQLETQNIDLKTQVRTLEGERRKLLDMLQSHSATCLRHGGLNLPNKLLQSPALKYLDVLELEKNSVTVTACSPNGGQPQLPQLQLQCANGGANNQTSTCAQRTVIPPMSTIKFSRNNGYKSTAINTVGQQLHHQQQQLPNGYCKPSPTAQELGYLSSPSQENICLPSILPQHGTLQASNTHQIATVSVTDVSSAAVTSQLTDYIPNCENSLGLVLGHTPTALTSDDSTTLLGEMVSPLAVVGAHTTATEFVKNELVDSQSPYTTAQSAERFLFENNCDSFVDTKHAVSVHPNNHSHHHHNNNNSISALNHNSNNASLLDFNSTLIGSTVGIVPFHDQISIKNDYLNETDLLAQLTGDGAEFVDLDSNVAAAFMTNSGCLA